MLKKHDGQLLCDPISNKLVSARQLLRALEKHFEKGTYSVEMRHNCFYIYVDDA
jgi:hypothetical protein